MSLNFRLELVVEPWLFCFLKVDSVISDQNWSSFVIEDRAPKWKLCEKSQQFQKTQERLRHKIRPVCF